MTGVANVVLQIGSKLGPGGFASLQAGIGMISQFAGAVSGSVAELERFAVVMRNVDMEVVNYADSMAKGQVDTFALMKAMGKFQNIGLKVTKEQFASLAKAADEFADKTGEDTTAAFEKLTGAIQKGSDRGLLQFGIQLDETTDKGKAQIEALERMHDKYSDVQIDLDGTADRVYRLSNNWGTMTNALYEALTAGTGPVSYMLDLLGDGIGYVASGLTKLTASQKDYIFSNDMFNESLQTSFLSLKSVFVELTEIEKQIIKMDANNLLSKLTDGKFGFDSEYSTMQGIANKFVREERERKNKESLAFSGRKATGGGGAKESPDNFGAEAIKTLEDQRKAILRQAALEQQIAFNREEALRGLLDVSLGMDASIALQADREAEIEKIEKERVANLREMIHLLGLETEISLDSREKIAQLHEDENELLRIKAQGMSEHVDFLYAEQEALLESQERWDEDQKKFVVDLENRRREYIELKEKEFEQELRGYGLRDEAIEQVMQLDLIERQRALNNIDSTDQMVRSVNRLSSAWGQTRGQMNAVARAYEQGTEGMTKAGAAFFYIDAIIGAISEAAKAAASFASYDIPSGILHTASVGLYVATAAMAASHGGSSGGSSGAPPAPVTATAGRYSGGYERGGEESKEITVTVTMDHSAAALGALVDLSDRNSRAGLPAFKRAS